MLAVLGRSEDIQISDRFLAAAKAAADLCLRHAVDFLHIVQKRLGKILGDRQPDAMLRDISLRQFVPDFRLCLWSEAAYPGDLPVLSGLGQIVQRSYVERLVKRPRTFRPDAGYRSDLNQSFGNFFGDFVQKRQMTCLDDFLDFARKILADRGKFRQILTIPEHIGDVAALISDRIGRIAVGADAKTIGALDFQQISNVVEHRGYFAVVHGHDRSFQISIIWIRRHAVR